MHTAEELNAVLRAKLSCDRRVIKKESLVSVLRELPIISTCPLTTLSGERTSRKLIGEMGKQELNLR